MEILIKLKELSKENEIWRLIPNCSNYFISNLGRVYLINTKYPNGKLKENNDFTIDKDGYYRINYKTNDGKYTFEPIHRVVAKVFLENNDENKTQVNHIDANRLNNKVSNLEWCTPKENVYHSYQYGNRKKCLEVPKTSKLTAYQISQIPVLRQYYSLKKISDLYNISYTSIKNIVIKLKRLSQDNQQPSIYGIDYHNEGSTTIPKGSTSQANGDGNALPTNNSSEDIV